MFRFISQFSSAWCFTRRTLCSGLNRGPPTPLPSSFVFLKPIVFLENVRWDPSWQPSTFFHSRGFSGTLAGGGWKIHLTVTHQLSCYTHVCFFCVFERMQTCKHVVFVCGGVMALAQLEQVISSSQYDRVSLLCALGEPTTNQIANPINTAPPPSFSPGEHFWPSVLRRPWLLFSCFASGWAVCWWRPAVACCSQMTSPYSESAGLRSWRKQMTTGCLPCQLPLPAPAIWTDPSPPSPRLLIVT